MMMSKTIETKLSLHYMIYPFQGTQCLEMLAFLEVLTVFIVRKNNAFFRLRLNLHLFPVTQELMVWIRVITISSSV